MAKSNDITTPMEPKCTDRLWGVHLIWHLPKVAALWAPMTPNLAVAYRMLVPEIAEGRHRRIGSGRVGE
eukprot:1711673-Rhodomonas_salina.5